MLPHFPVEETEARGPRTVSNYKYVILHFWNLRSSSIYFKASFGQAHFLVIREGEVLSVCQNRQGN